MKTFSAEIIFSDNSIVQVDRIHTIQYSDDGKQLITVEDYLMNQTYVSKIVALFGDDAAFHLRTSKYLAIKFY